MCDKEYFEKDRLEYEARGLITRRQFGVLVAAGVSLVLPAVANAQATGEKDVEIKTPDGTADAYFVYPSTGSAAAVLIWPDIFGLRPAMKTMAKRLASSGYSVLVVNPFYRVGKTTATGASPIAEMMPFRKGMSPAGDMSDAKAFIAWLDQQPQVNRNRKIGTQGYCMGGPMTFHTASAVPDRVGAVASFHGGGLVGKEGDPNSPHLLAAASKASFLIAIAETDDKTAADGQGRAESHVRESQSPGGDRGVRSGARLVPARHDGLQRAGGREGVGAAARALQDCAGLTRA